MTSTNRSHVLVLIFLTLVCLSHADEVPATPRAFRGVPEALVQLSETTQYKNQQHHHHHHHKKRRRLADIIEDSDASLKQALNEKSGVSNWMSSHLFSNSHNHKNNHKHKDGMFLLQDAKEPVVEETPSLSETVYNYPDQEEIDHLYRLEQSELLKEGVDQDPATEVFHMNFDESEHEKPIHGHGDGWQNVVEHAEQVQQQSDETDVDTAETEEIPLSEIVPPDDVQPPESEETLVINVEEEDGQPRPPISMRKRAIHPFYEERMKEQAAQLDFLQPAFQSHSSPIGKPRAKKQVEVYGALPNDDFKWSLGESPSFDETPERDVSASSDASGSDVSSKQVEMWQESLGNIPSTIRSHKSKKRDNYPYSNFDKQSSNDEKEDAVEVEILGTKSRHHKQREEDLVPLPTIQHKKKKRKHASQESVDSEDQITSYQWNGKKMQKQVPDEDEEFSGDDDDSHEKKPSPTSSGSLEDEITLSRYDENLIKERTLAEAVAEDERMEIERSVSKINERATEHSKSKSNSHEIREHSHSGVKVAGIPIAGALFVGEVVIGALAAAEATYLVHNYLHGDNTTHQHHVDPPKVKSSTAAPAVTQPQTESSDVPPAVEVSESSLSTSVEPVHPPPQVVLDESPKTEETPSETVDTATVTHPDPCEQCLMREESKVGSGVSLTTKFRRAEQACQSICHPQILLENMSGLQCLEHLLTTEHDSLFQAFEAQCISRCKSQKECVEICSDFASRDHCAVSCGKAFNGFPSLLTYAESSFLYASAKGVVFTGAMTIAHLEAKMVAAEEDCSSQGLPGIVSQQNHQLQCKFNHLPHMARSYKVCFCHEDLGCQVIPVRFADSDNAQTEFSVYACNLKYNDPFIAGRFAVEVVVGDQTHLRTGDVVKLVTDDPAGCEKEAEAETTIEHNQLVVFDALPDGGRYKMCYIQKSKGDHTPRLVPTTYQEKTSLYVTIAGFPSYGSGPRGDRFLYANSDVAFTLSNDGANYDGTKAKILLASAACTNAAMISDVNEISSVDQGAINFRLPSDAGEYKLCACHGSLGCSEIPIKLSGSESSDDTFPIYATKFVCDDLDAKPLHLTAVGGVVKDGEKVRLVDDSDPLACSARPADCEGEVGGKCEVTNHNHHAEFQALPTTKGNYKFCLGETVVPIGTADGSFTDLAITLE